MRIEFFCAMIFSPFRTIMNSPDDIGHAERGCRTDESLSPYTHPCVSGLDRNENRLLELGGNGLSRWGESLEPRRTSFWKRPQCTIQFQLAGLFRASDIRRCMEKSQPPDSPTVFTAGGHTPSKLPRSPEQSPTSSHSAPSQAPP